MKCSQEVEATGRFSCTSIRKDDGNRFLLLYATKTRGRPGKEMGKETYIDLNTGWKEIYNKLTLQVCFPKSTFSAQHYLLYRIRFLETVLFDPVSSTRVLS